MNNKKIPTWLGTIIIIAIAVTVGMFVWQYEKIKSDIQQSQLAVAQKQKNSDYQSDISKSSRDISEEKQILNNINIKKLTSELLVTDIYNAIFKSDNNIDSKIEQSNCINWIRKDGVGFGISGWQTSAIRSDVSTIDEDVGLVGSFLISKGFIKNEANTITDLNKTIVQIPGQTFGFEKGNLKCLVEWSEITPDLNPKDLRKDYFKVSCAEYASLNENTFQAFFNMLGNKNTKSFCIEKQNDNFSKGLASGGISGWAWYAKKINGKWTSIWSGQDYPPCSKVNDFPRDYYEKCLD